MAAYEADKVGGEQMLMTREEVQVRSRHGETLYQVSGVAIIAPNLTMLTEDVQAWLKAHPKYTVDGKEYVRMLTSMWPVETRDDAGDVQIGQFTGEVVYVATGERPAHLAQRLDTREKLPDGQIVSVPKLTQLGHVKVRVKNFCSTCGGVHDPDGVIAYPAEVNDCPGAQHARGAGHSIHIPTKYTPAPAHTITSPGQLQPTPTQPTPASAHNNTSPSQPQPNPIKPTATLAYDTAGPSRYQHNPTRPTSATAHNTTNPSQSQLTPIQPTSAPTHNTTNPSQSQPSPTQPNPAPAHNTTNPSCHNTTTLTHTQPATAGKQLSQDRVPTHQRQRLPRTDEGQARGGGSQRDEGTEGGEGGVRAQRHHSGDISANIATTTITTTDEAIAPTSDIRNHNTATNATAPTNQRSRPNPYHPLPTDHNPPPTHPCPNPLLPQPIPTPTHPYPKPSLPQAIPTPTHAYTNPSQLIPIPT